MQPESDPYNILRSMVRQEDRVKVDAITHNKKTKEDDMGLIPDNLDEQYEEVEAATGTGGYLDAGEYEGTVIAAEIKEGRASWVDAELSLKLQVTDNGPSHGKVTFADFEVAPLTDKSGAPSTGKLKFIKWQLESLGYHGKLSDLEGAIGSLFGAQVRFEQKVDTHIDPNTGEVDQYGKMNPKTGKPYVDREVVLKENILPGVGAPTEVADIPAAPTVY